MTGGLRTSARARRWVLVALAAALTLLAVAALGVGAAEVPWSRALRALWGPSEPLELRVVRDLRAPRVLLAILVGGSLAAVGSSLQSVLQNELADPYILGVSAGAGVGATVALLFGPTAGQPLGTTTLAFLTALLSVYAVHHAARIGGALPGGRLLLAGVAWSSFATALSAFLLFFAPEAAQVRGVFFWLLGGLAGANWTNVWTLSAVALPCLLLLFLTARTQTILRLGDEAAHGLGIDVARSKGLLIALSALLTATTVAVAGAIGFVGLIVPHALRPWFGPDQRYLLPASALGGGLLLLCMDTAARSLFAPEEVPVGVLTGLLGAPFFLLLLRRQGRGLGPV